MSFLDRIASAVMPAATEEDRRQAREKAESLAHGNDWLAQVLDHHRQIEALFAKALSATGEDDRKAAMKELAMLLTGHSMAEEAVLYSAIVEHAGKTKAAMAFEEQAMAKVQLAELEKLDPGAGEWREKLEHIKSAVEQHVYQEEDSWFPEVLHNVPEHEQARLTARYSEEFGRYHGSQKPASAGTAPELT